MNHGKQGRQALKSSPSRALPIVTATIDPGAGRRLRTLRCRRFQRSRTAVETGPAPNPPGWRSLPAFTGRRPEVIDLSTRGGKNVGQGLAPCPEEIEEVVGFFCTDEKTVSCLV